MNKKQFSELTKHDFFIIPTMIIRKLSKERLKAKNNRVAYISVTELKNEVLRLYKAGIPILAGTDSSNLGLNYGTDLL